MSNSKKDSNIIIFHHKRDDRDAFDGRSYLERSRMELNEKGPITLYRERYTLAQTRRYAEEGVAGAQYAMGEIYYFGTGDASDMDIAIDWYTRAAEQGHVDAQFKLGYIYEFGECEKVDYKEAEKWFLMAAEQGDCSAQFHLANLYRMRNNGVEDNMELAFKWMLLAAEHGGAHILSQVAYMYETGEGVEQDYEKALEWYLKAGYRGDKYIYNKIGDYYRLGKGVEADYERAAYWYKKALKEKASEYEALDSLGIIYLTGGNNLKADLKESIKWFKKAAKWEEDIATCFLNYISENGKEAGHDVDGFKEWLYKKAGEGVKEAGGALSDSYSFGYITPIDEAKSEGWLEYAYGDILKKVREAEKNRKYDYTIEKDMPAYMKAQFTRLAKEREELESNVAAK